MGQGDEPEALQQAGPIYVGGFVKFSRNALETSQEHDGDVGHEAPDIR